MQEIDTVLGLFLAKYQSAFQSLLQGISASENRLLDSARLLHSQVLGQLGVSEQDLQRQLIEYEASLSGSPLFSELAQIQQFCVRLYRTGLLKLTQEKEEGEPEEEPQVNKQNQSAVIEEQRLSHSPEVNEFAEQTVQQVDFSTKLRETISKYEQAIEGASQSDRVYIIRTIDSLKKQLASMVHSEQQKQLPAQREKRDDKGRRQAILREVFQFYCRLSHMLGPKGTFDRIKHQTNVLTWQKLISMLKDFELYKVQLPKHSVELMFKKASCLTKELDFEQFQTFMGEVAKAVFQGTEGAAEDYLFQQIIAKKFNFRTKFKSLPFSTKERVGFRAEKNDRYNFNMVPHSGKVETDLRFELEKRRVDKATLKETEHRRKESIKLRLQLKQSPKKHEDIGPSAKSTLVSFSSIDQRSSLLEQMPLPIEELDSDEEVVSNSAKVRKDGQEVANSTRKRAEAVQRVEAQAERARVVSFALGPTTPPLPKPSRKR